MSIKTTLIFCSQVLLIQSVFSQCGCGGNNYGAGLSGYGLGAQAFPASPAVLPGSGLSCGSGLGYGAGIGIGPGLGSGAGLGYGAGSGYSGLTFEVIPTSGGSLLVTSTSPIAPQLSNSLSVSSENVFEGALSLSGELPFLSAASLEGALPSGGIGVVSHSCGNGVSIESLGSSAAAYGPAVTYNPGAAYASAPAYGPSGACTAGLEGIFTAAPAINSGLNYGSLPGPSYGCGCGNY